MKIDDEKRIILIRIVVTIVFMIVVFIIPENKFPKKDLLFFIPYFLIGYDVILEAIENLKEKEPFDEHFLMVVATIGALALGEMQEAVMVMLLYQIGEFVQDMAIDKSKRDIGELMDIRPDFANLLLTNGNTKQVKPEDVPLNNIIVVKPGEKVPLDGIIIEGETSFNTVALNGESLPRRVKVGDEVLSGFINIDGLIKVKTTSNYAESTVSKILNLLDSATEKKSESENFISKFARVYTPIVCILALMVAVFPHIIGFMFNIPIDAKTWIYRALTFLVISCPCALVISIPLAFYSFIGYASNSNILIKASSYIESLAKSKIFCFDKTGTVTKGVYEVVGVHHNVIEEEKLLEISAHAEAYSTHPIAECIKRKYEKDIEINKVKDVAEVAGLGIKCKVDDKEVLIGNDKLMERENVEYIPCKDIGTVIHIAIDKVYQGHLLIRDVIKTDSKECMENLTKNGVEKIILLSGDKKDIVEDVAKKINIQEFFAELLPNQKIEKIEEYMKLLDHDNKLVFVGDGINDAPVIKRADVGIAMGHIGSDSAVEACDIVIMDDNPNTIVKALQISKKCMSIVWQNIIFAIGVKLICLILSGFGISNMWLATFADVGCMLLCVLNSMKIILLKKV